MGLGQNLLTKQSAAVVSLCKAEYYNQEISSFIGDILRCVERSGGLRWPVSKTEPYHCNINHLVKQKN